MIHSIDLENFQKHKNLHLKFEKGVNVIVGRSDIGKTSIIRGFQWILTNRPFGRELDGFITDGGDEICATLKTDDHEITRRKNKKTNEYVLDGEELKAFGTDVPIEVISALKMNPELHIQHQHDALSLLNSTPTEAAKKLNETVGVELMMKVTSALNSMVDKHKKELSKKEIDLENINESLKLYEKLPDINKMLIDIKKTNAQIAQKRGFFKNLYSCVQKLKSLESQALCLPNDVIFTKWQGVKTGVKNLEQKKSEYLKLRHMIKMFRESNFLLRRLEKIPESNNIDEIVERLQKKYDIEYKIIDITEAIQLKEDALISCNTEIEQLSKKFHDLVGERCPLCGK